MELNCRAEDNIKRNIKEIGCNGVDYFHLAKDGDKWLAVVSMEMNIV